MPRAKAKSATAKTGQVSPDEEWEEWMDWENEAPKLEELCSPTAPDPSASAPHVRTSEDSLDLTRQPSKKRKLSFENIEDDGVGKATATPKKPVQDRSHSVVEKRYRENLNQKIADLRDCIPRLRQKAKEDRPGEPNTQKQNKATVLTEAMSYIRELEKRNQYLEQLNSPTRDCFFSDETSRETQSPSEERTGRMTETNDEETGSSDQSSSREPPKGLIPVPEEMRRLWDGRSQEHYADSIQTEVDDDFSGKISIPGRRYIGRMVFGSLAGMMILDGLVPPPKHLEKREERGLAALPIRYLLPQTRYLILKILQAFRPMLYYSPLIKAFLVFSLCGLVLFFYLYYSKPPPRKTTNAAPNEQLSHLATPLEVRRNAWLTSIQTVWVPRRHILPEMFALILETAAYLTRKLLGWRSYSFVTGRTEEEEVARVRAWEIALDAQLSGGDPEFSKTRLVLTLWASGTLPNTPARLMLKAVHIRVLFWQPSRFAVITRILHNAARLLAHQQWENATQLQEKLDQSDQIGNGDGSDPLPETLKALLKLPCNEVLTDTIVQRSYNLAWNIPDDSVVKEGETDDESVDDSAMLGPLDKLALWHENAATHTSSKQLS